MSSLIEHYEALAIHCYYIGERDVGLRVCEKALSLPLTDKQEAAFRSYRTWYTKRLSDYLAVKEVQLKIEIEDAHWTQFNPSIVATETGWSVNVRSSNYQLIDWNYVAAPEDHGRIRTKNYLAELDDDFNVLSCGQLHCEYPKTSYPVDGLEDIRLNRVEEGLYISATLRNLSGWDGTCRIAYGRVDGNQITDLTMIPSPSTRHEKNWMPLVGRKHQWLYSPHFCDRVALADVTAGMASIELKGASTHLAKGFRGGSQAVLVEPALWLACVHEVGMNGGHRVYEHRLVLFDENDNWRMVKTSPPFVFHKPFSIEFVAGMAVKGDQLVISFGDMDKTAHLAELRLSDVLKFLVALE